MSFSYSNWFPDCIKRVSSGCKRFNVSNIESKDFQSLAALPFPPYTIRSSGIQQHQDVNYFESFYMQLQFANFCMKFYYRSVDIFTLHL